MTTDISMVRFLSRTYKKKSSSLLLLLLPEISMNTFSCLKKKKRHRREGAKRFWPLSLTLVWFVSKSRFEVPSSRLLDLGGQDNWGEKGRCPQLGVRPGVSPWLAGLPSRNACAWSQGGWAYGTGCHCCCVLTQPRFVTVPSSSCPSFRSRIPTPPATGLDWMPRV